MAIVTDDENDTLFARFTAEDGGRVRVGSQLDGFAPPTPAVSATFDGSGNLVIADVASGGKLNQFIIGRTAGNVVVTAANDKFLAAPAGGVLSNGDSTLTIPAASIAGSQIIVNAGGGYDLLTVDLGIPLGKTVTYSGGGPTTSPVDKLLVRGGNFATATLNHTNATDGSVVAGADTINYTSLEAVDFTGTTIASLVLNMPNLSSPGEISYFDIASGNLTVTSHPSIIPSRHPADTLSLAGVTSLTINGRLGDDNLTLNPSMSAYSGAITIDGGAGSDQFNLRASMDLGVNSFTVTSEDINLYNSVFTSTGNQVYNGELFLLSYTTPVQLAATSGEIILGGDVFATGDTFSSIGPGNINLNGASRTFAVVEATGSAAIDLFLGAVISNGSIVKTEAGTLRLFGANTYGGTTAVQDGTLQLAGVTGGGNRLPIGTTLTLGSGATGGILDLTNQNQQVAGLIFSGTGVNRVIDSLSDGVTPVLTVATAVSITSTSLLAVLPDTVVGEANFTYTWSVATKPAGAADPQFSANGTNAAKSSTATFTEGGDYSFTLTIDNAGATVATSTVLVSLAPLPPPRFRPPSTARATWLSPILPPAAGPINSPSAARLATSCSPRPAISFRPRPRVECSPTATAH